MIMNKLEKSRISNFCFSNIASYSRFKGSVSVSVSVSSLVISVLDFRLFLSQAAKICNIRHPKNFLKRKKYSSKKHLEKKIVNIYKHIVIIK